LVFPSKGGVSKMSSTQRKLRLVNEILSANTISDVPCDKCFLENRDCYVMPNSGLKCAECTRVGRPCVNMSWSSLDHTREEYRKKVEDGEKLLAEVITRLLRDKKILKVAEDRARRKALCLASELQAEGELEPAQSIDCPAAASGIGASPAIWSTLGMVDDFVATLGVDPWLGEGVVPVTEAS
jgi:hypothetical protein